MKIENWLSCVQDRGKWKEVVEKTKTFNQEVQRLEEEEDNLKCLSQTWFTQQGNIALPTVILLALYVDIFEAEFTAVVRVS